MDIIDKKLKNITKIKFEKKKKELKTVLFKKKNVS